MGVGDEVLAYFSLPSKTAGGLGFRRLLHKVNGIWQVSAHAFLFSCLLFFILIYNYLVVAIHRL